MTYNLIQKFRMIEKLEHELRKISVTKQIDILFSSCYRSCDFLEIVSRYSIIFAVAHFLLLQVLKVLKPSALTRFVSSRLKIYQVSMTFYAVN